MMADEKCWFYHEKLPQNAWFKQKETKELLEERMKEIDSKLAQPEIRDKCENLGYKVEEMNYNQKQNLYLLLR